MNSYRQRLDAELRRLELSQQESAAKTVPYISFILTHVALVLFLVVAFFIDRLVSNPSTNLALKIGISIVAVLFLASEWAYAIVMSLRWKRNILIIRKLEEEQRLEEEAERQRQQEEVVVREQMKNRVLQYDVQRLREREREQGYISEPRARSVRPQSTFQQF